SRIKTPTPCEALSLLRPVQLAGGEQTLFLVTPDENYLPPAMVLWTKVAVNSGGKHCLALTPTVKCIHGEKEKILWYAHSAAITSSGHVLTWEKSLWPFGSWLSSHRIACGSGDAQTLCITDDDNVWIYLVWVYKVEIGSQFSVALTKSGAVYTWGKGDFHRWAMAQPTGDGTVSAIQRPRLVQALTGKHMLSDLRSAHTLALSTSQLSERVRPPPNPPLEYYLVRDLPPEDLHARLVLLHHFSELLCPRPPRKVITNHQVRNKTAWSLGQWFGRSDGMKSVFGQMVQKLPLLTQEALSLPHRVWKVKFVGESWIDCGGGYSESIAEMCEEYKMAIQTLTSVLQMNMSVFGVLMGIASCRTRLASMAGEQLRPSDLTEVDRDYVAGLLCIQLPFSTSSAKGHEVPLSKRYTRITPQNRQEYVRLALNSVYIEFDEQVKAVRDACPSNTRPSTIIILCRELQADGLWFSRYTVRSLKSVATYKGFRSQFGYRSMVLSYGRVFEQERSLFYFFWVATRLPRNMRFRGRISFYRFREKSARSLFTRKLYLFLFVKDAKITARLLEKLKYAIHFCKSIDTE
ncbi:putative E3 ubiquitin-protein ligase HERC2, partial [Lucilia cuprina]